MFSRFFNQLSRTTAIGAVMVCGGWSYVASAQTATGQSTPAVKADAVPSEEGDIVVTGQRAADRNAIATKRRALQVIDVLSADDIGRMADFSIGDALKRVAGVNTLNYQGEPRFASIRGFNANYITTTLDGIQIASPDNQNQNNGGGRKFYLESLPSNIASRIEIFKTSTPDMAGHSAGGSINFAIPSAFDFQRNQFSISAKGGIEAIDSKFGGNRPTYQGEVFLSRRFGVNDQFGLSLSGSYWRREMWLPDAEQGGQDYWYNANGTNSGKAYVGTGPVGSERRWMLYDDNRERGSVVGKLDWRPGGPFTASITGFYFTQDETAIRHDTILSIGSGATVSNQTATTGTISPRTTAPADTASNVRTYALYFDRKTYGGQADIGYAFSDKLKFDLRGGISSAIFRNPQISDNFIQNGLAYNYQTTSDGVFVTPVDQTKYDNLALYGKDTHFIETYKTNADHYEVKARLGYNMDMRDRGFGVESGFSFIRNTHDESYDQTTWAGLPITLPDVISSQRLCSLNCNNGGLYLIDAAKLQSQLATSLSTVTPTVNTAQHNKSTFGISENVTSGYLTTRYLADNWSVVAGLRFERTDFSTYGFQAQTTKVGTATVVNYVPVTAKNSYDHWLPSINLNYDLRRDMQFRAAYSRTIGRPKFTDMSLLGGALNVSDPNNPTLATGNPALKPRVSDNFDLSYEWYFDRNNGLFSVALFHKIVQDEIYLLGQAGPIDIGGGVLVQGTITKPVNSANTTTVDGIEFNFIKYFDFLPGILSHFGVNANGIFSKAHFPIQLQDGTSVVLNALPDAARTTTNLALFYEGKRFHARVAWNHTGAFIEDRQLGAGSASAAAFYRVRYLLPSDIIDSSMSLDITDRFTVRVDVTNLTGQGSDSNLGLNQEIPATRYKIPTAIMGGFSYKF